MPKDETAPPTPDNPVTQPKGLAAKLYLLRENYGMKPEDLSGITTLEDADLLLSHFEKNNIGATKEETTKAGLQLKANFGGMAPEVVPGKGTPRSVDDVLRPLKRDNNLALRYNPRARILPFFDEQYPDGRIG